MNAHLWPPKQSNDSWSDFTTGCLLRSVAVFSHLKKTTTARHLNKHRQFRSWYVWIRCLQVKLKTKIDSKNRLVQLCYRVIHHTQNEQFISPRPLCDPPCLPSPYVILMWSLCDPCVILRVLLFLCDPYVILRVLLLLMWSLCDPCVILRVLLLTTWRES